MLFGFTTIGIILAIAQQFFGYRRKSAEAFVWTLAGFGFWGVISAGFKLAVIPGA